MSRWEFMRQLEELLSDISPAEREEALQYYNDYFNDAGRENEQEVVEALGSPAQVAKIVRDGLGDNGSLGEFTESGFKNAESSLQNPIVKRENAVDTNMTEDVNASTNVNAPTNASTSTNTSASTNINASTNTSASTNTNTSTNTTANTTTRAEKNTGYRTNTGSFQGQGSENMGGARKGASGSGAYDSREIKDVPAEKKAGIPTWAIVLIIIGCILLAPAVLGTAGSIIGAVFGLIATIVALVVGIGAAALVMYIAAVLLIVAGVGCLFVSPVKGIGLIGGGCICAAIGILFMLLTVFLAGKCIPALCRGIAYVFRKIKSAIGGKKG